MSGTIGVEARPGGGTIFTVVLPVRDMEIPAGDKPRLMRRKVVSTVQTTPKTPEAPLSPPLSEDAVLQAPPPTSTSPAYFDQSDAKSTPSSPLTTPRLASQQQVGEPPPPAIKSPASSPVLQLEDEPPDTPPDTPPRRTAPRLPPEKPPAPSQNRAPEKWPPDPNNPPQPTSAPLSPDTARSPTLSPALSPGPAIGKDEIRLTVLVVDDSPWFSFVPSLHRADCDSSTQMRLRENCWCRC